MVDLRTAGELINTDNTLRGSNDGMKGRYPILWITSREPGSFR
jgi:hypothetical protein